MEMMSYELKIPKERVAVLIGKVGSTKKEIEKATKTEINIDSNEGDIQIKAKEGLDIYNAKEIVTAIGRGFNPEIALLLLKVDYLFEIINLAEFTGKSKEQQARVKGRVIGREGKTRELIEELAEVYISVYGKTVSIIGPAESVTLAHQAVLMLLEGSTHATVYSWLEKKRKDFKKKSLMGEGEEWKMK